MSKLYIKRTIGDFLKYFDMSGNVSLLSVISLIRTLKTIKKREWKEPLGGMFI